MAPLTFSPPHEPSAGSYVPTPSGGWLIPAPAPASTLESIGARIQTVPWETLVPLRSWLRDSSWRRGMSGAFLVFAGAPFVLLQLAERDESPTTVAYGFSIYFGAMWLLFIHRLVRPERLGRALIASIVVFTTVAGGALAIALEKVLAPDAADNLLRMIIGVGIPEELAKALPVFLFLFLRHRLWTPRLYLFAGVISGITFGVSEAITYSALYEQIAPFISTSQYAAVAIWRLLTDGLFHACFCGLASFFIGIAAWHRRIAGRLITMGLVLAGVLHGAYDRFSGGWSGPLLALLVIALFTGYVRFGDRIAVEMGAGQHR